MAEHSSREQRCVGSNPTWGRSLFLSLKEKKWAVSGGVVVLPCFVLNRSHRFNHVCACTYMCVQSH